MQLEMSLTGLNKAADTASLQAETPKAALPPHVAVAASSVEELAASIGEIVSRRQSRPRWRGAQFLKRNPPSER